MKNKKSKVPQWDEIFPVTFPDLNESNTNQKEFYEYWSSQIEKGNYIDIEGNLGYIYAYLHPIILDFLENENIEFLLNHFETIRKGYSSYPKVEESLIIWESDAYYFLRDYKKSFKVKEKIGFKMDDIINYGILKNNDFINAEILANNRHNWLTKYGLKNKTAISGIINDNLNNFKKKHGKNIVRFFLEDFDIERDEHLEKLEEYFIYKDEFKKLKSLISPRMHNQRLRVEILGYHLKSLSDKDILRLKQNLDHELYSKIIDKGTKSYIERSRSYKRVLFDNIFRDVSKIYYINDYIHHSSNILIKALENELRRIIRQSEDIYRIEMGLPRVGEEWVGETELYYKIKKEYPDEKVIHHGRPFWLGKQHLDIYFPEKNIGIEFQGDQHNEPIDFFGGDEALQNRIELDERKRRLCKENNCKLIYVYPDYDWNEFKIEISRILKKKIGKIDRQVKLI